MPSLATVIVAVCAALIFGVFAILYAIGGPSLLAAAASLVFGYYWLKRLREADRAQRAQQAADANQHKREQDAYRAQLLSAARQAEASFFSIPRMLLDAEQLLDRAEKDFEETAFSPFWDSIEGVVNRLNAVDGDLKAIQASAHSYVQIAPLVEGRVKKFPVELSVAERLIAANKTGERLRQVVRKAHRNYEFTNILEQRKTRQALVAGFATLEQAIEGVGMNISSSLNSLGEQVGSLERATQRMHAGLESSLREIASAEEQHRDQLASKQTREAEKQLAMLDNIQRGREPQDSERGSRW